MRLSADRGGEKRPALAAQATRRAFLAAAGAACAGGCVVGWPGGGRRRVAARSGSGRLAVGVIGAGGRGALNLAAACRAGVTVAALCDVDETALMAARDVAAARNPAVRLYKDFRVMLDAERGLDAVIISTPDHGHGLQAAWALAKGCHVYLETPAVRTLGELRRLRELARSCGAVVQVGDSISASEECRRAAEVLKSGVLGPVAEVHAWTSRPVWPQGIRRPEGSDPVPPSLDWDLWLCGAPARPFKNRVYHRFNWRGWSDFGTGALGDAGFELLGLAFRVLRLGAPAAAEATVTAERVPECYPKFSEVRFDFAAGGRSLPAAVMQWYDGGRKPDAELMPQVTAAYGQVPSSGCLMIGAKGVWLTADETGTRHALALRGEERVWDFEKHEACLAVPKSEPRVKSHLEEFFEAVRGRGKTCSGLEDAAPLAECLLAGCVAQRVPGRLEWNARKGRFANSEEANLLLAPVSPEGWTWPV